MQNLITAGELANLAGTTKRTILWYDRLGIIKPVSLSAKGYRYYDQSQVLEYQIVLLLTTLGVSLKEISQGGDLRALFAHKKQAITDQIKSLKFNLASLTSFMANIDQTGTMVNPRITTLPPFDVYYFEKVGSYVKIDQYCRQLRSMFRSPGSDFTTLAIFDNPTYQPQKSLIKISALATPGQVILPQYQSVLKKMTFNPGRVISHTHRGSGRLLSLFWKELEKYCRLHHLKIRHDIPDFEIYRQTSSDPTKQIFEIYLPIQ